MTSPDLTTRFWAKVNKNGPVPPHRPELGPCWLWTASVNRGGYGEFSLDSRTRRVHRLAYEFGVGPIPESREIDHLCRVRTCVNWQHLEAVTRRTNWIRGEHPTAVCIRTGMCVKGLHEMTEANTQWRGGKRQCRTCANATQRSWRHARAKAQA